VKYIKLGRLIWAGHVMRTEDSDSAKEVLCTRLGGNEDRRTCRPKSRWCDKLVEDVVWVGYTTWRVSAQSRQNTLRRSIPTQGGRFNGRNRNRRKQYWQA
jgi:hypothetical protein